MGGGKAVPCSFRWGFHHMGVALKTGSCFYASLSLPWPVRRPAVALGRFLALDLVVCCSSTSGAVIEFWFLGPAVGLLFPLLSGNWKTSRSSSVFRGYGSGFPPPTAGRSFIGGTSACSGLLLRLTSVSLAFELWIVVFCGGFPRGY